MIQQGFKIALLSVKRVIFLSLLLISFRCKTKDNKPSKTDFNKWLRCVVNLEVRPQADQDFLISTLERQLHRKEISLNQYREKINETYFDKKMGVGTAIYFTHGNKDYLVTARHVLAENQFTEGVDSNQAIQKLFLVPHAHRTGFNTSTPMITNLNIGPIAKRAYIFSNQDIDLAILCLNETFMKGKPFIKTLRDEGYEPIRLEDVEVNPIVEKGLPVFAFGFPAQLVVHRQTDRTPAATLFKSVIESMPAVSEGFLGKEISSNNHMEVSIFLAQGSSGGALVFENKLIGIISGIQNENKVITNKYGRLSYKTVHTSVTKAGLLLPLLQQLESRFIQVNAAN